MSVPSALQLDRLQESLRVPPVLGGRYHVTSVLGRGGMGVVYLADDARLERKVAVKVIDPALASDELEARLEREARLLGRLSHPGIVPIYDLGRQDELTLFYVMKHVDGETLEHWLPAHPSRAERLRLFQKLCDPVAFAHAQGVAHRDLKPANVMIGAFGEVLIMDWGLARAVTEPATDEAVGTPGYADPAILSRPAHAEAHATRRPAVPRQAEAAPSHCTSDTSADIFSLGAILYFLLTGHHPPQSDAATALAPSASDKSIDPRLNAICVRATHPQRAERYASVRELEEDVLRYLDGEAVHAYRERWHESAARWVRRHQLWLTLILVYLLMRVVVALIR